MDKVILVDQNDHTIGEAPKLEAHLSGVLHRAFSVLIYNSKNELLLQQRALGKYHSPGLWTNTCCSHPAPGEDTKMGALRRLEEEMGMTAELDFMFKFTYKHEFENGLTEHEIDHVFIGYSDALPVINKQEVHAYKYMSIEDLKKDVLKNPDTYTPWFAILMNNYSDELTDKIMCV